MQARQWLRVPKSLDRDCSLSVLCCTISSLLCFLLYLHPSFTAIPADHFVFFLSKNNSLFCHLSASGQINTKNNMQSLTPLIPRSALISLSLSLYLSSFHNLLVVCSSDSLWCNSVATSSWSQKSHDFDHVSVIISLSLCESVSERNRKLTSRTDAFH